MDAANLINTSTIAKLYRTTTGDIEKKLTNMGIKPVRTVTMQSGRRFMVWDKKVSLDALDKYKAERLELMRKREQQRQELADKSNNIPRTGYGSPDVAGDEPSLDPEVVSEMGEKILSELAFLKERVQAIENLLRKDSVST